jgi:hypothetical protein
MERNRDINARLFEKASGSDLNSVMYLIGEGADVNGNRLKIPTYANALGTANM